MMRISLIVATDEALGIGLNNQLLCHLPADLKYFRLLTTGHHIMMGRKTFESIGKPLPGRTNMIISRQADLTIKGCIVFNHPADAIAFAQKNGESELFIIGGAELFNQSLSLTNYIYFTCIHHTFRADTFFPALDPQVWKLVSTESHQPDEKNIYAYDFCIYKRQESI